MAYNWQPNNTGTAGGQTNYGGGSTPNFMDSRSFAGGAGMGSLINALRGMFGGHGPNPATEANNMLGQIPGQTEGYYKPYIDAGKQTLEERMKRYGQNPTDIYKNLGSGFTESPGYKFQLKQAMDAANQSAASGGMSGTPLNVADAQERAQGLASKDYENYLNHVTGIYDKQNEGLTDITHGGQEASQKFGDLLASIKAQQSANTYKGTEYENNMGDQDWGELFKSIPWLAYALL